MSASIIDVCGRLINDRPRERKRRIYNVGRRMNVCILDSHSRV